MDDETTYENELVPFFSILQARKIELYPFYKVQHLTN